MQKQVVPTDKEGMEMIDLSEIKNPYERAIKWLEREVYKNGTFSMHAETVCVDVDKNYTYSAHLTGNYSGFTVSSQHVNGEGNFLQLINTMMLKETK